MNIESKFLNIKKATKNMSDLSATLEEIENILLITTTAENEVFVPNIPDKIYPEFYLNIDCKIEESRLDLNKQSLEDAIELFEEIDIDHSEGDVETELNQDALENIVKKIK